MYSTLLYTGAFFVGVIVSSVAYFAFQPTIKGWLGERKVNKSLKKMQKQGLGRTIKDLTLITKDGLSSQIDHIFINRAGIFVIETKNHSGKISGRESDLNWKQHIGKKKYTIGNYARQNANHIKALSPLLSKYPGLPVYSFISFNPDCHLDLELTRATATRYNTLANAIKIRSRLPVISEEQVSALYKSLKAEKNKNILVSKTHISRVSLQHEADIHAKNMKMSRHEYNDMLVEKYKQRAITLTGSNNLENIIDNASTRSKKVFSDEEHNPHSKYNVHFRE